MNLLAAVLALLSILSISQLTKAQDCEVCQNVIKQLSDTLSATEKSDPSAIETKFKKYCKTAKNKEQRFCYYVGGAKDSATGIIGEMTKPMSWGMPADKVCQKLKKKDGQICDLKYDQALDWKNINLKKMRVRELKKILTDWDEQCSDCLEKGDFIRYIESIKHKYVKEEL